MMRNVEREISSHKIVITKVYYKTSILIGLFVSIPVLGIAFVIGLFPMTKSKAQ